MASTFGLKSRHRHCQEDMIKRRVSSVMPCKQRRHAWENYSKKLKVPCRIPWWPQSSMPCRHETHYSQHHNQWGKTTFAKTAIQNINIFIIISLNSKEHQNVETFGGKKHKRLTHARQTPHTPRQDTAARMEEGKKEMRTQEWDDGLTHKPPSRRTTTSVPYKDLAQHLLIVPQVQSSAREKSKTGEQKDNGHLGTRKGVRKLMN